MIYFTEFKLSTEGPECARCGTKIKGLIASICEVCQESLWVTGIRAYGGGGGGSGNKSVTEDNK